MKVYIIEEHYFCDGGEWISCIKAFTTKEKAEQFVSEHENEYETIYEIVELNLE